MNLGRTLYHSPVQYDGGCDAHGGTTERHCAVDGHPMPDDAPCPQEVRSEPFRYTDRAAPEVYDDAEKHGAEVQARRK